MREALFAFADYTSSILRGEYIVAEFLMGSVDESSSKKLGLERERERERIAPTPLSDYDSLVVMGPSLRGKYPHIDNVIGVIISLALPYSNSFLMSVRGIIRYVIHSCVRRFLYVFWLDLHLSSVSSVRIHTSLCSHWQIQILP